MKLTSSQTQFLYTAIVALGTIIAGVGAAIKLTYVGFRHNLVVLVASQGFSKEDMPESFAEISKAEGMGTSLLFLGIIIAIFGFVFGMKKLRQY